MEDKTLCVCGDPNCKIPYGTCHCGMCGQETPISDVNHAKSGYVKGRPHRYIAGHQRIQRRPVVVQPEDTSKRHISLTKGQVTLVDTSDYEEQNKFLWFARRHSRNGNFYAVRNGYEDGKQVNISLHEAILKPSGGKFPDHIDGDTLNNTRANLREATNAENSRNQRMRRNNKSGVKGVSRNVATGKWIAQIWVDMKCIRLGEFDIFDDAVRVRREAEIKYHGEFRRKSSG